MSSFNELPIILVSAKSEAAASKLISELIDNEPEGGDDGGGAAGGRVWRLVNKYYTADVLLRPAADGAPPPPQVEGHVIYLEEDEGVAAGAARALAGRGAGVRVLALEAARVPAVLAEWSARARVAPVALRAAPPAGLAEARAALHAHVWPGMRAQPGAPTLFPAARGLWSSGSEDSGSGDEGGVERAEHWAAALGAMSAVRDLPRAERRAAAEALVRDFARALGADPDTL